MFCEALKWTLKEAPLLFWVHSFYSMTNLGSLQDPLSLSMMHQSQTIILSTMVIPIADESFVRKIICLNADIYC